MLDSILTEECEDSLHAASQDRWTKANTYSYDGARKSVEALLLTQGWRIRAVAGAHAACSDVVEPLARPRRTPRAADRVVVRRVPQGPARRRVPVAPRPDADGS